MKLVINRKEWRRGPQEPETVKNAPTALLCKDGTKCCLGFYALQCGLKPEEIRNLGEPNEVEINEEEAVPAWLKLVKFYEDDYVYRLDSPLAGDAIEINDSSFYSTDEEREAALIARFAKEGIEVEFNG